MLQITDLFDQFSTSGSIDFNEFVSFVASRENEIQEVFALLFFAVVCEIAKKKKSQFWSNTSNASNTSDTMSSDTSDTSYTSNTSHTSHTSHTSDTMSSDTSYTSKRKWRGIRRPFDERESVSLQVCNAYQFWKARLRFQSDLKLHFHLNQDLEKPIKIKNLMKITKIFFFR